jgi:hypothetical protein
MIPNAPSYLNAGYNPIAFSSSLTPGENPDMKKTPGQIPEYSGQHSEGLYASCKSTFGLAAPCCTVLESISDGVFTVDFEKRITFLTELPS